MYSAAEQNRNPYVDAVRVQERLFTSRPILLGMEFSMKHQETPCGLKTDSERARKSRKLIREMLNSQGNWQSWPSATKQLLKNVFVVESACSGLKDGQSLELRPALMDEDALPKTGSGKFVLLSDDQTFGREQKVADELNNQLLDLAKWVRRLTGWNKRVVPLKLWRKKIQPLLENKLSELNTPVDRFYRLEHRLLVQVRLDFQSILAHEDSHGVALLRPHQRQVLNKTCEGCNLHDECRDLKPATGVALLWKRLKLVDSSGKPTLRGRVVSFFSQNYGLGIAAALEDVSISINELVYELANLDAGFRFSNEDDRWKGRIPMACRECYGDTTVTGYLDAGVPPRYGSGAESVVAALHLNPSDKGSWITEFLGSGDIDRAIIEWRSLLRQIKHSPELEWPRWAELQELAGKILTETQSPTLEDLPSLEYHQRGRVDHQLRLRSY